MFACSIYININLKSTIIGRRIKLDKIEFKISNSADSPDSMFAKYRIIKISDRTVKFDKPTDNNILIFFFVTPVSFEI